MNKAYIITAKVTFPEGVALGAGISSNKKIIDRNGSDQPILRGTALAGVLRSAYTNKNGIKRDDTEVIRWFGKGQEDDDADQSSVLIVEDAVIEAKTINERTHNMINRHTGSAVKKALFTLEAVPPLTTAQISLTLNPNGESDQSNEEFMTTLMGLLGNDVILGGDGNRGIGRMQVVDGFYRRTFDLDTIDGMAGFWDAKYIEHRDGVQCLGEEIRPTAAANSLAIALELGIPRGEDLLVGDGQEIDYALQPQKVLFADGTEHWRIPGSAIRGVFRAWMTRLAVRDGKPVRDSVTKFEAHLMTAGTDEYNADWVAWGGVEEGLRKEYQENPALLGDPILDLFGSLYKRGRIHFTDSFAINAVQDNDVQDRMHVAIDRFSGGANEGALFNNQVLIGDGLVFQLMISIESPTEKEVEWLRKTLVALHLGILSVGSSKSAGRLEIRAITATGTRAEVITRVGKELV